jgi:hypothetical protein
MSPTIHIIFFVLSLNACINCTSVLCVARNTVEITTQIIETKIILLNFINEFQVWISWTTIFLWNI